MKTKQFALVTKAFLKLANRPHQPRRMETALAVADKAIRKELTRSELHRRVARAVGYVAE